MGVSARRPGRGLPLGPALGVALTFGVGTGCIGVQDPRAVPLFEDTSAIRKCGGRASQDQDHDSIADELEGNGDPDHDGIPNLRDTDSDGDGRSDSAEADRENPCAPPDSDGDGVPDFRDVDSDNDGLDDATERRVGTSLTLVDTDADGVSDLVEVAGVGSDPADARDGLRPDDILVVLPYGGDREERNISVTVQVRKADVFLLMDTTGSMTGERRALVRGLLGTLLPGLEASIPDLQVGVGALEDYPLSGYGTTGDVPFSLLRSIRPVDEDVAHWSVQVPAARGCSVYPGELTAGPNAVADLFEAVNGLTCPDGGNDDPEAYVPALWALAAGRGLEWPGGVLRAPVCGEDSEGMPTAGYACFRHGALPIVVVLGDTSFHNGPGGTAPYDFPSPSYEDAIAALRQLGARVVGVYSEGDRGETDFSALCRDTGTLDADGEPFAFSIGDEGENLSETVVAAVTQLVGAAPADVTATVANLEGNLDRFDASRFVVELGTPADTPMDGILSKDHERYYGVSPGTQVSFAVTLRNDVRPAGESAQLFRARLEIRAGGSAVVSTKNLFIVVPPANEVVLY